ncbi:MAG: Protein-export rane protein SecF [Candidatus Taylorbacteria bacterium]|nr:Protein-export rane protein SecF [Candidatus Taylorbacteria bacterium]
MFVVTYRKLFYALSTILIVASIGAFAAWGLNLGIDFKGGSIMEVEFANGRPDQAELHTKLAPLGLQESIRPTGDNGYIIRMRALSQDEKAGLWSVLTGTSTAAASSTLATMNSASSTATSTITVAGVTEKRFDSIGPVLGAEAARKSVTSIILVILAIVIFITYAFRQVSHPISSWKYGIVAIIALAHDVIIPIGAFSILGHFAGYETDTLFVTALLVVLGFSVHDTIVVFDRVRENLRHASAKKPFGEIVGESISQTFTRSINTSLTTLLSLLVLYFIGGEATHHFALALIIGIIAGTYSSIFIGSPLLVTFQKWAEKKKA